MRKYLSLVLISVLLTTSNASFGSTDKSLDGYLPWYDEITVPFGTVSNLEYEGDTTATLTGERTLSISFIPGCYGGDSTAYGVSHCRGYGFVYITVTVENGSTCEIAFSEGARLDDLWVARSSCTNISNTHLFDLSDGVNFTITPNNTGRS